MRKTIATALCLLFLSNSQAFPVEPPKQARKQHPMQAWMQKHSVRRSIAGALGGALAGVALAVITGNKDDAARFAAAGAVAGAVIGFKLGQSKDQQIALRDDTITLHQYAGQGYVGGVDSVGVSSEQVKPGETISITAGFWAVAPEANTQFKIERGSGLRYIGIDEYAGAQPVKPSPFTVTGGGQWVSTFAFTIPPALPPGTYEVEVMMDSPNFPEPVSATQRITVAAAS
jgi:hypothetical protein